MQYLKIGGGYDTGHGKLVASDRDSALIRQRGEKVPNPATDHTPLDDNRSLRISITGDPRLKQNLLLRLATGGCALFYSSETEEFTVKTLREVTSPNGNETDV